MKQAPSVEDIMTSDCECAREHDSIIATARTMARLDIGAMPVCSDDERLKGILTDRDIVVQVVGAGMHPADTEVGQIAYDVPYVVRVDDTLERAFNLMADRRVRRLPVVDKDDKLVGMVSQADIAMNVDSARAGKLVASISAAYGNSGQSS